MEQRASYEVRPEQYTTVIRQLLSHEDDLTNQRLMWLLVVQGLLFNAFVPVRNVLDAATAICIAGTLVTFSVFESVYKAYQARGYLKFLGEQAKRGLLPEKHLRFDGWPVDRLHGWRSEVWICPWLERFGDLLDPYMTLPALLVTAWLFFLLKNWISLPPIVVAGVAVVLSGLGFCLFCVVWTWSQGMDAKASPDAPDRGS